MSETLAGIVEHVTFHNAENGFVVFRARIDDRPVTIVGRTPASCPANASRPSAAGKSIPITANSSMRSR